MAKKDEVKAAEVVAPAAEVVDETAPQATTTAVAVQEETAPVAAGGLGVVESYGPTVLDWSYVHLKFEMSKMRPDGNQGEFFLGREWEVKLCDKGGAIGPGQLPKPNQRFEFVIVGRKDGYKHYVTQDEFARGVMAARYPVNPALREKGWIEARKAALAAGETIGNDAWHDEIVDGVKRRVGPTASEYMQLMVLIKKPADCENESIFSIPLGGEFYAPAYFEFDKLNWFRAYKTLEGVLNAERNKVRVDPKYRPRVFDKVFWGYSSAVTRPGRNGSPDKVVTTPMMTRAIEDGKPVSLSAEAIADLEAVIKGGATAANEAEEETL